jgi:hypothetical protein
MISPRHRPVILGLGLVLVAAAARASPAGKEIRPAVLGVRDQVRTINAVTRKRLETLLPRLMAEQGLDMWLIVCNEDHLDPVFRTMIPADTWCPITQILVLSKPAGQGRVERLNLSRTNMRGLHTDAWDWRAWDEQKKESQWACLARIVKERDPKTIGLNESGAIWAADGLTATLKKTVLETIGPIYAERIRSAETLATLWLETLLPEETELYDHVAGIARALLAETFSERNVVPGVTTTDDLLYSYMQKIADWGLQPYAWPTFRIRARDPEIEARYGKDETVIRRGDALYCDAGILYLRYYTDHAEWAYVLKPGETDAPAGLKKIMAEGNRLQDIYASAFKAGLSGNKILAAALDKARQAGIPKPKIYSHSIGYFLHQPGPLIGLPWEQADTGARGEVVLVPDSLFTAELSVTAPLPEWGGREFTMALEQVVAFTAKGLRFAGGRQTQFYLIH